MKRSITLEEMHQLQLDMLVKVHEYCTANNLRYSLGGGTLLGAVRHKGYIPWDDDIDIMMPRPDYDKFVEGFQGKYEHLICQTYKNDERFRCAFAKVYNNKTTLVEKSIINGIFIDVFPIEGLPEDKEELNAYIREYQALIKKIIKTTRYYKFLKHKNWLHFKYYIKCMFNPPRKASITKLEAMFHKYPFESSKLAGAITGRYLEKEFMDTEVFKHYILLPFEGYQFSCIAAYDAYLTQHYGNYMQLPPKEQQVTYHNFKAWWN